MPTKKERKAKYKTLSLKKIKTSFFFWWETTVQHIKVSKNKYNRRMRDPPKTTQRESRNLQSSSKSIQ